MVTTGCDTIFAVSQPAEMTRISATEGALFAGSACREDRIWILDFDPTDGFFYQTNENQLAISTSGKWSFHNAPIGNDGDEQGTVYPVVVLRASQQCGEALANMKPDDGGTVKFKPLPASCPASSDASNYKTVNVVNDRP
ncbi:hypothetical protein [Lentzea sp. NPDC051838]|uniref:hypothetical protein n=1 Tax=Lentzea sp. NPDC051838 TaxID=3154849 RepID=UPI0034226343